ncbi:MAG: hypothetical protein OEZ20_02255, partial [candidate division WOR-3 bacterium]|nr:hypothetical protein [candidate division WOR-3 bacterium]
MNKFIVLFLLSSAILVESSQTNNLNSASVISEPEKLVKIDIRYNHEIKFLAQKGICLISAFD